MFKDAEEDEKFSKQFGEERSNMICCLGIRSTPSSLWSPKTTNEVLKKKIESLHKMVHDLTGQVETLQVRVTNICGSIVSMDTLVEYIFFYFHVNEIG